MLRYLWILSSLYFIGNKKPKLGRTVSKGRTVQKCEESCEEDDTCIFWWWKKRGRGQECIMWNLTFQTGKNMAAGLNSCNSSCSTAQTNSCVKGNINHLRICNKISV